MPSQGNLLSWSFNDFIKTANEETFTTIYDYTKGLTFLIPENPSAIGWGNMLALKVTDENEYKRIFSLLTSYYVKNTDSKEILMDLESYMHETNNNGFNWEIIYQNEMTLEIAKEWYLEFPFLTNSVINWNSIFEKLIKNVNDVKDLKKIISKKDFYECFNKLSPHLGDWICLANSEEYKSVKKEIKKWQKEREYYTSDDWNDRDLDNNSSELAKQIINFLEGAAKRYPDEYFYWVDEEENTWYHLKAEKKLLYYAAEFSYCFSSEKDKLRPKLKALKNKNSNLSSIIDIVLKKDYDYEDIARKVVGHIESKLDKYANKKLKSSISNKKRN